MDEHEINIAWEELQQAVQATENNDDEMAVAFPTILDQTLDELSEIDVHTAAGLSPSEKPTRSHEMVCVSNEVISCTQTLGGGLAYYLGSFFCFIGTHWAKIGLPTLRAFLFQASLKLGIRMVNAKYHRYLDDLVKQCVSTTGRDQQEFSSGQYLINFRNGTLEIIAGDPIFRKHRKEDMLTYVLDCDYDPKARCEKWLAHLNRVLPNLASQMNLAEFFGSVFIDLKLEKALVLVGDGKNGKSVVFDVIRGVLGAENVTHYSLESLNSEYHRTGLAGHLLNYASEIGRNPKAEVLKKIVSGEPIEARLPYGNPFIMYRYARLAFNANELPMDVEHTDAFFRRLLILPFNERITDQERNPRLAQEIVKGEAAGVINWMIGGLMRVVEQQAFTDNPLAQKAVEEYRLETNSVALFASERGYKASNYSDKQVKFSDLYADYRLFCKDNVYHAVSSRNMAKRLRALGFTSEHKKHGVYFYVGEATKKPLF